MQKSQKKADLREKIWFRFLFSLKSVILLFILLVLLTGSTLVYNRISSQNWPSRLLGIQQTTTVAVNGANRWDGDTQVTAPTFNFSLSASQAVTVSPLFSQYYESHSGLSSLGPPITVAYPVKQGWVQFFTNGALLLSASSGQSSSTEPSNDPFAGVVADGIRDPQTGIVRLALLRALLTTGSQMPIGGDGSPLTYVDLRKATNPDLMLPAPAGGHTTTGAPQVFVKGGLRLGRDVGHFIPESIWTYINRPDLAPDGWKVDVGVPLTEALPFTLKKDGVTHHLFVQVFERDAFLLDQEVTDAATQIQRLNTGIAYLRTVGLPAVAVNKQTPVWTLNETPLLDNVTSGHEIAHVGAHFPLTLLGETTWKAGILWYHVQWTNPKQSMSGWLSAQAMTLTSPGQVLAQAAIDALSPDLQAYLQNLGNNVGTVVYDLTRQRSYSYNGSAQFLTASSIKVPIMLTFLDMVEGQGREPDDEEMGLLSTMIENSNNDSASELYYNRIGGAQGVTNYLQKIGITDINPDPAWGYSLITPQAMVNLLTDLYTGKILTPHDRDLAMSLMEQVESDQQAGVGDTAPNGSTVALKNGWVTGPDDQWVVNSSGIVMAGRESYIIAVYTQEQSSLDDGNAIARHVCGTIASLLV